MSYSDSHVHLDSFPQEDLDIVIAQMKAKNVSLVLNVSINLRTSEESIKLARKYKSVWAAIGIHPGEAIALTPKIKQHLEEMSGQPRVVAFGEIGLMYGRSTGSKEEQQELFAYQLSLANNLHKPVDLHYSHDAHQDVIAMVKKEKGMSGIVHDGFQDSPKKIREWLDLGFYISLGKPAIGLLGDAMPGLPAVADSAVRAIPADRLITETDSMARMSVSRWKTMGGPTSPPPPPGGAKGPQMKEEFNQPTDVIAVAEKIAAIRGVPASEIGNLATANLKRILKV